jgi:formate dehydrogenase maturation protein FdhE
VLVALSGLVQAGIQIYLSKQSQTQQETSQAKELAKERGEWLPSICPACGAPLSVSTVNWTGLATADCPYCKANLKKTA